ncbi:MAG TPA: hypothetical protein VK469_16410 [Candidatus Kapabacteria bacterium]|nr:hypothetical protein [Candidatus Kapabacteria bacterium]
MTNYKLLMEAEPDGLVLGRLRDSVPGRYLSSSDFASLPAAIP